MTNWFSNMRYFSGNTSTDSTKDDDTATDDGGGGVEVDFMGGSKPRILRKGTVFIPKEHRCAVTPFFKSHHPSFSLPS